MRDNWETYRQYTNAREPYDDAKSVEEVVDGESIPDAFKR
jgi:hypothetical protein